MLLVFKNLTEVRKAAFLHPLKWVVSCRQKYYEIKINVRINLYLIESKDEEREE
jgi:hypothetical protein